MLYSWFCPPRNILPTDLIHQMLNPLFACIMQPLLPHSLTLPGLPYRWRQQVNLKHNQVNTNQNTKHVKYYTINIYIPLLRSLSSRIL
jgi:hypothetical protein